MIEMLVPASLRPLRIRLAAAVTLSLLATVPAAAKNPCAPLTANLKQQITIYMGARYHIPPRQLVLTSGEPTPNCYQKVDLQTTSTPVKHMELYITPDQHYLVPELFDINTDPLRADREEALKASKTLASVPVSLPTIGPAKPAVSLVIFSDFQCPFCKRLNDSLKQLKEENTDVGITFRNFPLPMHPWAGAAARISVCVVQQHPDMFWKLNDFFFDNQKDINAGNLQQKSKDYLVSLGAIDTGKLSLCQSQETSLREVNQDVTLGQQLDISATPTYFINGVRFQGTKSPQELKDLIESASNTAVSKQPQPLMSDLPKGK